MRRSRCNGRGRLAVVGVLVAALVGVAVAGATSAAAPKASTPLTIRYTGTFTMSNKGVPETTVHSSTFTVGWTYWWTGTWKTLFRDPSIYSSSPVRFSKVMIKGKVVATYKEKVDDTAVQTCTSRITRDNANRPTVSGAYDTSAGTLQITVEAPTFRGITFSDLNCADGPGSNVFGPGMSQSPPASFNPLGAGGKVSLAKGGTVRYDKTWKWKHTYASATNPVPYREYKATMRSGVTVWYTPCRLITACARAKP